VGRRYYERSDDHGWLFCWENGKPPHHWKALSKCIGHADVAFTMKQYVQTDMEADRQVANTLAELIIGGTLASVLLGLGSGRR
jgi:hypothetical protein